MRKIAFWLSLILVFVTPWENIINIEALGTVSRAIGLLVGAFWVATVLLTGHIRKPHGFHWVFLLFILWNGATLFWTVALGETQTSFITYLQLGVLVYIYWDLYRTPDALNAGLQAYIFGAYVALANLLNTYLTAGGTTYTDRLSVEGFNANDLGLILALGIPMAWYLATLSEKRSRTYGLRIVNFAYIPLAVLGVVLTASRSAMGATLPALLYIFSSLTQLKLSVRVAILVTLGSALVGLQSLAPQASTERLAETGTEVTKGDLNGRLAIWREGFNAFLAHPILGVGSGAFEHATESGEAPHNFLLAFLVEGGFVGLALFVLLFGIALYLASRQSQGRAGLWLAILIAWVIGAITHNWEHRKQTWLMLSLAVASAELYLKRDRASPDATIPGNARDPHQGTIDDINTTADWPQRNHLGPPFDPHQLPASQDPHP